MYRTRQRTKKDPIEGLESKLIRVGRQKGHENRFCCARGRFNGLGVPLGPVLKEAQGGLLNSSSSALASFRSAVSKPSVNQL